MYDSALIARARALHEAGWGYMQIARLVAKEHGVRPRHTTIRTWVDPAYADSRRERSAASKRAGRRTEARLGRGYHTETFRLERMRGLREAGVSFGMIARTMNFDWPDHPALDENSVRYLVGKAS